MSTNTKSGWLPTPPSSRDLGVSTRTDDLPRRPVTGIWVDAGSLHPRGEQLIRDAGLDPDAKWWRD